jgi:putative ABC transport system substrate-binding protein
MDRRRFLLTSLAGALAAPLAAEAQQRRKVWRIGWLSEGPGPDADPGGERMIPRRWFFDALRALGYIEGENLTVEYRFTDRAEQLPELAAQLVGLKLDLIAAAGTQETLALKAATSSIPIVMVYVGDPVGAGIVQALTQPGSNISLMHTDLGGKRVEVLREIVPNLRRLAVLWNPKNRSTAADTRAAELGAQSIGIQVRLVAAESPEGLAKALNDLANDRPEGLVVVTDGLTFARRQEIAEFAVRNRFASVFSLRAYAASGGLVSYGPDMRATAGRAATYVDKILKGAKPADLPIEQPTKFELVINLKTAKALGLTIPPSLLARADQVLE